MSLLYTEKEDCTTGIAYCRQAIQLTFAANKIVGKLTACHADEYAHEEDNLAGKKRRRHGGSDEIPTKLRRSLLGSPSGVEEKDSDKPGTRSEGGKESEDKVEVVNVVMNLLS